MKEDCKLVWVKVETCCRNSLYVHGEYSLNFSFRLVETDLEKCPNKSHVTVKERFPDHELNDLMYISLLILNMQKLQI